MGYIKEKILTREQVIKLDLDNVSVITADMLDGYTSIGYNAFYGCTGLTSMTIPNSVTSIGNYAFYDCSGLTSVTIPNSVTSIGEAAFEGCSSLTSVTIESDSIMSKVYLQDIFGSQVTEYIIGDEVTSIGDMAFVNCTGLTSIEIPNSVTSIGESAFKGCRGLASVLIDNKEYKTQEVKDGKCKAYKAFNADMTCRSFQYEEGKTYELDDEPKLCKCGFHACLNLTDVFSYYWGKMGDIVVHEVYLEGVSDERHFNSKVVAKKITISKRIL